VDIDACCGLMMYAVRHDDVGLYSPAPRISWPCLTDNNFEEVNEYVERHHRRHCQHHHMFCVFTNPWLLDWCRVGAPEETGAMNFISVTREAAWMINPILLHSLSSIKCFKFFVQHNLLNPAVPVLLLLHHQPPPHFP